MKDKGYTLARATSQRVRDATSYVSQFPRNAVSRSSPPLDYAGSVMFLTTTSLSRMSYATPGSGLATMQTWLGPGYPYANAIDFGGAPASYTIINDSQQLIASGAYCLCCPGPGGYYHFLSTSCVNVTQ